MGLSGAEKEGLSGAEKEGLPDPEATGVKSSGAEVVVMSLARLGLGSSKDSILFLFIF